MITIRLIQTKANFGKIYELREENKIIGTTKIPINLRTQINVSIANKSFKLQFSIIKDALSRFNRVIAENLTNEYEEAFTFDGLRATQVTKQQVSTAYMKPEDTIAYFEVLSELSEQE